MFTRIRLVITVTGITAAAVSAALLSLTAAHGASGTPQRQEDAQAVGSLLTAPLPVPPEISLWPADSRNAATVKISRDTVTAEFQRSIGKNGTLHSVDYLLVTAPGYAPYGVPFKDKPAWVVVVTGRTEFPHGHPECGNPTGSSINASCRAAPVKPIHVNRFYVLDPNTGVVLISVGTVIP